MREVCSAPNSGRLTTGAPPEDAWYGLTTGGHSIGDSCSGDSMGPQSSGAGIATPNQSQKSPVCRCC
ncbi:hypothetical protein DPEC_G00320730 [Dallia pectoralis]|uniref:Uncharacterized protein n=1 Tax=Dallia pectoralis TaxID=75939 RepID=A0ACC2FA42_DALPE|nr:hypothetical protein DPEC_G00320730 [Dallia pectoralis]